ncbi:hypothetical protein OAE71_00220 [Synechococcus sp. AH-551-A21]|nr:hypothetical protein [Synechococcus sp. AH-551-A21]
MKLGYWPPLILLLIAGGFYLHDIAIQDKPATRIQRSEPTKAKQDWIKINKCLAASQAILIEETFKAYVAKLEINEWKQETSKLNMDKYNRDNNCKDKGYF